MKTRFSMQMALVGFVFVIIVSNSYAVSWRQIMSFSGSGTEEQNTEIFRVPGREWRIVWSYMPDAQFPELTVFDAIVYPKGENESYVEFITPSSVNQTGGTTYIHEGPGDYYVRIIAANTQAYSLAVEYDVSSVPQEGDMTVEMAVIAVVIVVAVLGLVVYATRLRRRRVRGASRVRRGK